jgi:Fe2+ transport system protein B
MPKIFISYRREDSPYEAVAVRDRLASHFGERDIFFDLDSIRLGHNFSVRIDEKVGECDYLIAVIGKSWLTVCDKEGERRLDNPDDWVRLEIQAALSRNIPVIAILLHNVRMPDREELPTGLQELAQRQAHSVRPLGDFRNDIDKLIHDIDQQEQERLEAEKQAGERRQRKDSQRVDEERQRAATKKQAVKRRQREEAQRIEEERRRAEKERLEGGFVATPDDQRSLRRKVQKPAWGLFATGAIFEILFLGATILVIVGGGFFHDTAMIPFSLTSILLFALVTASGFYMLRMRRYKLVLVGTIVSVFTLVAAPFAIWALIVLLRPEIRKSFE